MKHTYRINKEYSYIIIFESILGFIIGGIILLMICKIFNISPNFFLHNIFFYGSLVVLLFIDSFRLLRLNYVTYTLQKKVFFINSGKIFKRKKIIYIDNLLSIEKLTNPLLNSLNLLNLNIHLVNKEIEVYGLTTKEAENLIQALSSRRINEK